MMLTAILLGVVLCSTMVNSQGCDEIRIRDAVRQPSREGVYTKTDETCTGRPVYVTSGNYLFYKYRSGAYRWVVGPSKCSTSVGIYSEATSSNPEDVSQWSEYSSSTGWRETDVIVECDVYTELAKAGCDEIRIRDVSEWQTSKQGLYTKTEEICTGRPVYVTSGEYLSYIYRSGAYRWVVGRKCSTTAGIQSEATSGNPEDVSQWSEFSGSASQWIETDVIVECEVECNKTPCKNSGVCNPVGEDSFTCDCSNTGYTGENCTVKINTECNKAPCKNSGVCNPVGEDSFTCDCSNTGYTGDTCEDMPGLSTICGSTQVTITIDSTQVMDIDTSHLHIGVNPNEASCQPDKSGDDLVFTIDVDSCDPATTDDNGNIVYTYDILGNSTKETSIISRKNMMGIVVKCRYPTDKVLSTYIKAGISQVEYMGSSMGHFQFAIGMFKDSTLMTTLNKGSEVAIGESIFVKLEFTGPGSLRMVVKDCVATPTANSTDVTSWPLIKAGCYNTDTTGSELDSTVVPLDDEITDHVYAFEFESFRFLNVDTSDVYITCDLHVCGSSEENCVNPVVCEKTGMVAAAKRSTESRVPYSVRSISFSPVAAG